MRTISRCSPTSWRSCEATPDGDGSLLDHSLVMYGSGMGNGDKHDQNMVPIVLAGSAAGRLKGGRHIAVPESDARSRTSSAGSDKSRGSISASSRTATGIVEL